MLNKIKLALKKLSSWKPSFDPSKFEDDVALKTEWAPLKRGGTNFKTHKLVERNYTRIEFKSTIGAKLFSLLFFSIGVGIPIIFGREMIHEFADIYQSDFIFIFLFGLIFATVGGWLFYSFAKPVIFDKTLGLYWKGWNKPKHYMAKVEGEISSRIGDIHAIQIIPELIRSDNRSYVSYELNLVLKDGSRMNVVDHGNPLQLRSDAQKLSEFLGVTVWDVTID